MLIAELRGVGAAARSSSSSQPQTHPNSGGHTNIYPSDGSSHTMPKDCAPRTAITLAMARTAHWQRESRYYRTLLRWTRGTAATARRSQIVALRLLMACAIRPQAQNRP